MTIAIGDVVTVDTDLGISSNERRLVFLPLDGSRRLLTNLFIVPAGSGSLAHLADANITYDYPEGYIILYWGETSIRQEKREYLPYLNADTALADRRSPSQGEPVNQIPDLVEWRGHLSRFAHELDFTMGMRSMLDSSEDDRQIVYDQWSSAIGSVWEKIDPWARLEPNPNNPEYALTTQAATGQEISVPTWLYEKPELERLHTLLCGECVTPTFAREFLHNADLPRVRTRYNQGQLLGVDRSTSPWGIGEIIDRVPNLPALSTAQAEAAIADFFGGHAEQYKAALNYYDKVTGLGERAHGH